MACNRFVASNLKMIINNNASFPFKNSSICKTPMSNTLLDSGFIDTNDIGLNSPRDESLVFRTVLHCAPLETKGHKNHATEGNQTVVRYLYGPSLRAGPDNFTINEFTYQVRDFDSQYSGLRIDRTTDNFQLG